MPISLECPNGHRLRVSNEDAGRKILCPLCRVILRVPGGDEPPPPGEEGGNAVEGMLVQPPPAALSVQERLRSLTLRNVRVLRLGLGCHYFGLLMFLLCLSCLMMASPLSVTEGAEKEFRVLLILFMVWLGALTPMPVVLGTVLCLSVPRTARARAVLYLSLVLNLITPALPYLLSSSLQIQTDRLSTGKPPDLGLTMLVAVLPFLSLLGSWGFFMLFLERLAIFLGSYGEANSAREVLFGTFFWVGIFAAGSFFIGLLAQVRALDIRMILLGFFVVLAFVCLVGVLRRWVQELVLIASLRRMLMAAVTEGQAA